MGVLNVDRLYKKGLRLGYFTVGYIILEAIALIGFGFDKYHRVIVRTGLNLAVEPA